MTADEGAPSRCGNLRNSRAIGWNRPATMLLTRLCTHRGRLPQGAPTSPRLSNLVNYLMDARLAGLATSLNAFYSRYADDRTFSFAEDNGQQVHRLIGAVREITADYGYTLHRRKKLHIRRTHQRQEVCGLVVNEVVNLPRETRRRLRAVEHHLRTRGAASLTEAQLQGWRSFQAMVEYQRGYEP